jgi:endonuclease/exonuclease/phosphatase family metal-dependent hydrolase
MLVGVVAAACGPAPQAARRPAPGEIALRVMTYNVNYGIPGDADTLAAIRDCDAEVVFLQETNPAWERALHASLGHRYPVVDFVHRPAAGGMGFLSRYGVLESEVLEPPNGGWFPARRVVLDTPLGPVQFLGVHLRPQISDSGSAVSGYFTTGDERLAEIGAYVEHLDPTLPTLVLGDFNEGPSGEAVTFLAERGYRSALDRFDPGRDTWHWRLSVGELSFQLDHIVHDARLEPIDVRVVTAGRSDHIPVVGTFVRPAEVAPGTAGR